jgi:hypothetical protein
MSAVYSLTLIAHMASDNREVRKHPQWSVRHDENEKRDAIEVTKS